MLVHCYLMGERTDPGAPAPGCPPPLNIWYCQVHLQCAVVQCVEVDVLAASDSCVTRRLEKLLEVVT